MRARLLLGLAGLGLLVGLGLAQDATPTEPAPPSLVVWLPDRLTPPDSLALERLREQTANFSSSSGIQVELRLKRVADLGGIMSTLRSASIAAPAALPDLTLLRRQDVLVAEREGLIQALDGKLPAALIADMGRLLALGQIDQSLYGLPYMLDVEHLVYRPQEGQSYANWRYSAVLERAQRLGLSGAYVNGLNDIFLAQYLADGGMVSAEGQLLYDPQAMLSLLSFYERAQDADMIPPQTLSYTSGQELLPLFSNREVDQVILSSSSYLSLLADDPTLRPAPIPSRDGQPIGIVNGWSWVLVASTPERQAAAMRYVAWLMDVIRQNDFAEAAAQLPSLPAARQAGLANRADVAFYQALLQDASLPLAQGGDGSAQVHLMYDALASVIDGTRSASEALEWLEAQIDD